MDRWFRRSVIYQIYPKSFMDSNNDGIGDIKGIISKLDYLKFLGIDGIWITPIYCSPQVDNGYDISDYYKIDKIFGKDEDFDLLIAEAHKRDIKIIMDIVVNHTSDKHFWFKEAIKNKNNKYRDYYIIKKGKDGNPPNNWVSMFGGSAWEKIDEENYYLHLFAKEQPDLNWENSDLRKEIYKMQNFWMKRGVDGLRLDVINLISKDQRFLDDNGIGTKGKCFYANGPKIHTYLKEMNKEVFSKYNSMIVGETMSTTPEIAIEYTKPENNELDMIFSMAHLKADYTNGDKWTPKKLNVKEFKNILSEWQIKLNSNNCWNSLFLGNHDLPRMVSRFGNDSEEYRELSAKMLGTTIHFLRGTPYIYQGDEIGMTNPYFNNIKNYKDIESINLYTERTASGFSEEQIMEGIKKQSRDNSRTPMQWDSSKNAGFSKGIPWIELASNYKSINVKSDLKNSNSILYHYKKLIQLRKELNVITEGKYELLDFGIDEIWGYKRITEKEEIIIISNFSEKLFNINFDYKIKKIIITNYNNILLENKVLKLRAYESIVVEIFKGEQCE